VKGLLIAGAGKTPDMAGATWTPLRGYGRLDVPASLRLAPVRPDPPTAAVPTDVRLLPNFPNPFNASTVFRIRTGRTVSASVDVLDGRGRLARRLHDGPLPAGMHSFAWDGTDGAGRGVPTGVYVLRFSGPDLRLARKACLIR
jgi:hypothetical protein